MRCAYCATDLGKEETITAIQGLLLCNDCAKKTYSKEDLDTLSETVIPEDIGIYPDCKCDWCNEESDDLIKTDLGMLCERCIAANTHPGETVLEER